MNNINIINLKQICENKCELVKQLQCWGLIPKEEEYICKKCGGKFKLCPDNYRTDGYRWKCLNKVIKCKKNVNCNATAEFRKGTFFERSHLSIFQILAFASLWVENIPLLSIVKEINISYKTAIDWASFCREVVFNGFIENSEKLGGVGKIVEIDESKFGRRKYHRGHRVEGQWVFGGYERGSGKIFVVPVEDRGRETLLPIIQTWILPGTLIISDYWKAYDCLSSHGYGHLKVNHSLTFKDPETGAHTNSIESTWRAAKAIVCAGGRKKSSIPGNLARYMFYKRCAEMSLDRKEEFFKLAGAVYNPTKAIVPPLNDDDDFTDDEDGL